MLTFKNSNKYHLNTKQIHKKFNKLLQNNYEQIMNDLSLFRSLHYYIIYIPLKSDNLLTICSQFKLV